MLYMLGRKVQQSPFMKQKCIDQKGKTRETTAGRRINHRNGISCEKFLVARERAQGNINPTALVRQRFA